MAHQVVDAQAQVRAPRQIEQLAGLAIEPDDLALRIEHDHAIGHGRGGTPQFAEQPRELFLVKALATVQAHHLRHHVAPQPHRIRRIGDAAVLQPEIQRAQLPEIPGEVQAQRAADAEPDEPASQPEHAPSDERREDPQRDVDEGRGAGIHVLREVGPRTGIPNRARSGSTGRSRTLRALCAGAGCGRRWCAPRHRRCRPRRGRAAARACTRAPGAS